MQKQRQKKPQILKPHTLPPESMRYYVLPSQWTRRSSSLTLNWCGCDENHLRPYGLTQQMRFADWLANGDFFQQSTLYHKVFFKA